MRLTFWLVITAIAFVFYVLTWRVTRRLRRARAEVRRLRAIRRAYELEREAEDVILGIG